MDTVFLKPSENMFRHLRGNDVEFVTMMLNLTHGVKNPIKT